MNRSAEIEQTGAPAEAFIAEHTAAGNHVVIRTLRGAALLHPGVCGTAAVPCPFDALTAIVDPGEAGYYIADPAAITSAGVLGQAGAK